jgi:phytanoyl-CoA hydroxylase
VLYDLFQRHPEFDHFVRNETILNALSEVLGPNIIMYENSMVYKPKGKKNGVPFHQDFISRPNEPRKFIAWMAIDEVTENSGALKVIPGSHKGGFRPWYHVKGETHHDRMDTSDVELDKVMHVELAPGDVLIFNQLVVHGSDEMSTDSNRFVYRASYQGFGQIYTPRGTPIVVKGATPSDLNNVFSQQRTSPIQKPILKRVINRIGKKLVDF